MSEEDDVQVLEEGDEEEARQTRQTNHPRVADNLSQITTEYTAVDSARRILFPDGSSTQRTCNTVNTRSMISTQRTAVAVHTVRQALYERRVSPEQPQQQPRTSLSPEVGTSREGHNGQASAVGESNDVTSNNYTPIGRPYVSKDKTIWGKNPPLPSRIRRCNVLTGAIGPRPNVPPTFAIVNPIDAFMLYFRSIIELLVLYTNMEAAKVFEEKQYDSDWKPCDEIEMKAFVGLLLLAGVMKDSKTSVGSLWDSFFGRPFFRGTMTHHRFKQLLRFMRFDDKTARLPGDKFAPIKELFNIVITKLKEYYIPGDNITIDEQLVPFRGNRAVSVSICLASLTSTVLSSGGRATLVLIIH
jgi:hypothetical protein